MIHRFSRALLLPIVLCLPCPANGQESSRYDSVRDSAFHEPPHLLRVGSGSADRLRLDELLGRGSAHASLLQSLSSSITVGEAPIGFAWGTFGPVIEATWNSNLPFSLNDGAMWAGRGMTGQITGGAYARVGPLTAVVAPRLVIAQNLEFRLPPERHADHSIFENPCHHGSLSSDMPIRFGDRAFTQILPGESSLTIEHHTVAAGISNEERWWGPGIQNALVLSNNAAGFPHVFFRTSRPLRTAAGELEAIWLAGVLTESLYFDNDPENDRRTASGLAVTLRPAIVPDLTVGVARMVLAASAGGASGLRHATDAFTRWHGTGQNASDSAQQVFSVFGRWVFPDNGFELYSEWARTVLPSSVKDLLVAPQYSQGYTLGLQWAREVGTTDLVRIQAEVTDLEESSTYRTRPLRPFYITPGVAQGYTQRGQSLGAAIGPGSSSQWIATDYLASRWSFGGFVGRIRWDDDTYYQIPVGRSYLGHDVSVFAGIRGSIRLLGSEVNTSIYTARRFNFLFQNPLTGIEGQGAVDYHNVTVMLSVAPFQRR